MYSKDDYAAHLRVMAHLLTATGDELELLYQQANQGLIHYLNLLDGTSCACLDCLNSQENQE